MRKPFVFKQFTVNQYKAAFPVGTDSVILGCYADISKAQTLLDIGTGTGILSLIASARYPNIMITAIEPDKLSFIQAKENFSNFFPVDSAPDIRLCSLNTFEYSSTFDHIICNPPYFVNSLKNTDERKAAVRHSDSLPFEELCSRTALLAHADTAFTLILPSQVVAEFLKIASNSGWYPFDVLNIYTNETKTATLKILTLKRIELEFIQHNLYIRKQGKFTDEYVELTSVVYQERAFDV